jgi:tetratricopeptide (TPR) repeat protein
MGQDTPATPLIWGGVPSRNKAFCGREELLARLRQRLSSVGAASVPRGLLGLGGIGKTQLAVEYAHRYAGEYDLIWWIPADQPALVRAGVAALAPRIGIGGLVPGRVEESVPAVIDALRRGAPTSRWLLVFDGADQPEFLSEFMPAGPGHVLITSRNRAWAMVAETIEVDVFSREESLQFLSRRVPGVKVEDADGLAEAFGDLPLVLEQAAAWLAETAMTVPTYLSLLQEHGSRILAESPAPSGYPVPAAAAWSLSLARLAADSPAALELLRCCAFFGAAPIPLDVLEAGRVELAPGFVGDSITLGLAIRALGRFALARIDGIRRTIEVHSVVQRLIRADLDDGERSRLLHKVHILLADADPRDPEDAETWQRYADLLGHIQPSDTLSCSADGVRRLMQNVVRYLNRTGNFTSGLRLADQAVSRWTAGSADNLHVLVMTRQKIQLLQALARYAEADALSEPVLARMRATLGPDHEELLVLQNCHCINLRARGDFAASLNFTESSMTQHAEVFGADHPRTFAAVNNYAEDLELNGKYAAARQLHEEVLADKRGYFAGSDNPRVLFTLGALGRVTVAEGDYAAGLEIAERANAGLRGLVREHVLEDSHPLVLQQAVDLALAQRATGAFADSLALAAEAHGQYRDYFGARHPATLAAAACLANAERLAGDLDAAERLMRDTFSDYSTMFGADHPYTLACAINLAIVHRHRGDPAAARELLERAVRSLEGELGPQHHLSLICCIELASALAALGSTAQAIAVGQQTRQQLAAVLGDDHPHTLGCTANLALDLESAGSELAADLAEQARERLRVTLGTAHPTAQAALAGNRIDVGPEIHGTF